MLPKWIEELKDINHDPNGTEIERMLKALSIAWEALENIKNSKGPSDVNTAMEAMRRITDLDGLRERGK